MPTDLPPYISAMEVDARIREIAKAGLKGRLLLLLGAGFSKDARGYPLGHQLVVCGKQINDYPVRRGRA